MNVWIEFIAVREIVEGKKEFLEKLCVLLKIGNAVYIS